MRRTNLRAHMAQHSTLRPHSCDTCGKSFAMRWDLTLHARLHTNLYQCDVSSFIVELFVACQVCIQYVNVYIFFSSRHVVNHFLLKENLKDIVEYILVNVPLHVPHVERHFQINIT